MGSVTSWWNGQLSTFIYVVVHLVDKSFFLIHYYQCFQTCLKFVCACGGSKAHCTQPLSQFMHGSHLALLHTFSYDFIVLHMCFHFYYDFCNLILFATAIFLLWFSIFVIIFLLFYYPPHLILVWTYSCMLVSIDHFSPLLI